MTTEDTARRKLAQLKSAEASLRTDISKHSKEAAKKRKEAASKRQAAQRTSSISSRVRYEREAASREADAAKADGKVADDTKKLATNLRQQHDEAARLERAETATQRKRNREDSQRQSREKTHAREIARLSQPSVRHVHVIRQISAPQPEKLRVAYLTANPRTLDIDPDSGELQDARIRVDKEIRDVREAVKRSLYRDYIDINLWPAAMPVDLLNSLNDERPHVLHFSGHGGNQVLEFDDGEIDDPQPADVTFEQLAAVLAAIDQPLRVLVLNACDTLDGADVLLDAVPVIVATTDSISDIAANLLAVRFYAAVAAGQSVQSAVAQARAMIGMLPGESGDIVQILVRDDINLADIVLVKLPESMINEAV